MATKAALNAGRKLLNARRVLNQAVPACPPNVWAGYLKALDSFERAAIRVGEVRERGRATTPPGSGKETR